jgi:hypothetical protein
MLVSAAISTAGRTGDPSPANAQDQKRELSLALPVALAPVFCILMLYGFYAKARHMGPSSAWFSQYQSQTPEAAAQDHCAQFGL